MNSCILMAQIIQDPQLRYTQDAQTPVAEMMVEFDALKEGDAPYQLKVVAWRDLALSLKENYRMGDRVILQGRLKMNVIERQEGFKEKRAELTLGRIYSQGMESTPQGSSPQGNASSAGTPRNANVIPIGSRAATPEGETEAVPSPATPSTEDDKNLDDIPF
ncbi:MAG: single-stranded DNA-binding protein [Kamptonema sp. SIO4C4]|nr:single-stranded DNA-binding protein [Kamptonema sp. SIO4C4]